MKELKNAKIWANNELKRISSVCTGSVINVSANDDSDKLGGVYKDYFINAEEYFVSNYIPLGLKNEIVLDLEAPLSEELNARFDVVFSFCILEHIFEIRKAFSNLCDMAREMNIIVVPFIQEVHYVEGEYEDYWRPTPFSLKKMFEENGFQMISLSYNSMDYTNSYIVSVGVRPEWEEKYKSLANMPADFHVGNWVQKYGSEWSKNERIKNRIKRLIWLS